MRLKRGQMAPIKDQYAALIKNKLGLESKAIDSFLLEQVQRKRDEYCEASQTAKDEKDLEAKVMYYLKGTLMVNRLMKHNGLANCEAFSLEWKDTMASKSVKATTSNEENLNALYEFTVVKMKVGEKMVFGEESCDKEMEDGLQKLRNALWGMEMMRSASQGKSVFSDCDSGFWSVMELYTIVLCYAGLYRMHGGDAKMSYG